MRITSLTITFNMRTVNVILIKLITVVKVYLTNTVTKIQFGREKKSLLGKGGRKVNNNNNK